MARKPGPKKAPPAPTFYEAHVRLFADDVGHLKRVAAEKGLPWLIELRLLVRRAIKGEKREVVVLRDAPPEGGER